jgi:polysaccharide pyruvyl transferase WcaK-like protein
VVTRNRESADVLRGLGIATEVGTDTAWTFEPRRPDYGRQALRDLGWDGAASVLAVCPINPFWWPVQPSLVKAARLAFGGDRGSHYRSLYFHRSGGAVEAAYARYLHGMTQAVERFRREKDVFVVLVAMEMLDTEACRRMAAALGAPVVSSADYDMYQLVSVLRACHLMVSSRYHGIVTSMPALVASAGVTMDERIRNLMHERGHEHLLLQVDDADLGDRLFEVLLALERERDAVRDGIARCVVQNLQVMARMGTYLEARVQERYPEFPVRTGRVSWEEYLPPLGRELQELLAAYA